MSMHMSCRAALLAAISLYPVAAFAQPASQKSGASANTDAVGLQDIVVTAQRRSESLQRVPLAVSAIDSKALATRGITSLGNLATNVTPGVVVTQFAGTASTLAFNIRGAYSADPGIGLAEQGVAVYADGVPLGRAVGTGVELGDIERIEILRGPQGTLFGRNAEGGAVQFVTKRPSGEFGGRIEGSVGNYDARRIMAQIDLPKFANISIKIGGLIDRHGGYTKNLALPGTAPAYSDSILGTTLLSPNARLPTQAFEDRSGHGNFNDPWYKNQRGFRVAALWEPSPDFSAYYTFDYSNLDYSTGYSARTGGPIASSPAFCTGNPSCAGAGAGAYLAANIFQGTQAGEDLIPSQTKVSLYNPLSTNRIRGHGLTLDYHMTDNIELKSITGLRMLSENGFTNLGLSNVFVQFLPATFIPAVPAGTVVGYTGTLAPAKIDQKQFSEEFQFIGDFGDLKFTAGLFYYYERVIDTRSSFFSLAYVKDAAGGVSPVAVNPFDITGNGPDGLPNSLQQYLGIAHSYAAYGQATYAPSSILDGRLSLTVGLRYTKDKKEFTRLRGAGSIFTPANSVFDKDRFDPAVTLAFQATPTVNLYARYARAYRPGGTGIRNKLALTTYLPEVNTTYEAGFKTQLFGNRIRFNTAAYHSIIENAQVSFQNSNLDPSSTDVINVTGGNVKINGVETEVNWQVTPELAANIGYSYAHADLSGTISGPVLIAPGVTNPTSVPLAAAPFLPKHQLTIGVDYIKPIQDDIKVFAHADYSYMSDYFNDPRGNASNAATIFGSQLPNTLSQFNGRIGLRDLPVGPTKMEVSIYAYNLFDKRDVSYGYFIGSTDFTKAGNTGGSAYAAAPRTFGAQAKVQF